MVFLLWVCCTFARHEDVDSVEDLCKTSEESNLDDDTGLLSSDDTSNDLPSYSDCKSPRYKVKKQSKLLSTVTC